MYTLTDENNVELENKWHARHLKLFYDDNFINSEFKKKEYDPPQLLQQTLRRPRGRPRNTQKRQRGRPWKTVSCSRWKKNPTHSNTTHTTRNIERACGLHTHTRARELAARHRAAASSISVATCDTSQHSVTQTARSRPDTLLSTAKTHVYR